MSDWSLDLARKTYSIPHWSDGYFDVAAQGRIAVRPKGANGPAVALPNFGAVCRSFDQYDLVLFCYECGGAPLRQLLADAKPADGQKLRLAIVTGAEGGFAAEDAEMAAKAGAKTVGLGPRILRCETAPLAVLSAVMTLTGNLE